MEIVSPNTWLPRQSPAEGSGTLRVAAEAGQEGMGIFSLLPSVSSRAFTSHSQPEGSCVTETGEVSYLTNTLSRKVLRDAANTPVSSDELRDSHVAGNSQHRERAAKRKENRSDCISASDPDYCSRFGAGLFCIFYE